jgi:hypothetical protein
MPKQTWHINTICWGGGDRPTHITVKLDDPKLYSAIEQFVKDEGLTVIPSKTGQPDEFWIAYPREDFEYAKTQLNERITNLYWERRWTNESQFKVGDEVKIVEPLTFTPAQQPIFIQMYDEGVITKIIGSDLYIVDFKNSGTISDVPARKLQQL